MKACSGEWAAVLGDEVVVTGVTAAEVRRGLRAAPGESLPVVLYYPSDCIDGAAFPDVLNQVIGALNTRATERTWLVGGAVRDALLQRPIRDLDLAIDGDALAAGRTVANALGGGFFVLDKKRGSGRVILQQEDGSELMVDFARIRGASIVDDLMARDFSINAMGVPLLKLDQILDPSGGREDLRNRLIRAANPYALFEDPIRGIRAVRLANELGFQIERETRRLVRDSARLLKPVSNERLRDELAACLGGRRPFAGVRALDVLGLLVEIIPEIDALKGVEHAGSRGNGSGFEHMLAVMERLDSIILVLDHDHSIDRASELVLGMVAARVGRYRNQLADRLAVQISGGRSVRALLCLAALLLDVETALEASNGATGGSGLACGRNVHRIALDLKLASDEANWVCRAVRIVQYASGLDVDEGLSRRLIHRYFKEEGDVGVEGCILWLASVAAQWGVELPQDVWVNTVERTAELLDAYFSKHNEIISPRRLLRGDEIMRALDIGQGPRVGEIMQRVSESQAAGEIESHEDAIAMVLREKDGA